jgi:hypothetical protein
LFFFISKEKYLVNFLSLGFDRLALGDHAAMSIDFKGEGLRVFCSKFPWIIILIVFSFNIQSNNGWCDT